jgi:signal transduction histidine kinase
MMARRERRALAPTIRGRLTLIYGGLFLASSAALLAVTYLLMWPATAGVACYASSQFLSICLPGQPQGMSAQAGAAKEGPASSEMAHLKALASAQHEAMLNQLFTQSGIALAIMAAVSIALGWIIAGRVLRPIRTITEAAQNISATNLHERLALTGPNDELRKLGDTIDSLLARLDDAFDAQRRFVANASHELRTPLTVMRALVQMTLTDPGATTESFRAACQDVLAEADQQERLIEALLVLARSERGLDHREPLDLADITSAVLGNRCGDADRRGLRIRSAIEAAPIEGDARLAERLVVNVVDNAIRHNADQGEIVVSTGRRLGRSFLSVANTGPEVPADQVGRLFEPFQRIGSDSTDHSGGLGLGLSIVQAIGDAHGARLTARPRPGGGMVIEATFPQVHREFARLARQGTLVGGPGLFYLWQVSGGPLAQRREHRRETPAKFGDLVLHPGRYLGVVAALDEAIALELAQPLGEHLRGDGAEPAFQLHEPQGP